MFLRSAQYWNSKEAVRIYSQPRELSLGELHAVERCLAEGREGRALLDLGCGGGATTAALNALTGCAVGVDISSSLIDAAKIRYPGIDFRVGTAEALEFDAGTFDIVFVAGNALDYIDTKASRIRALNEVHRVLRPRGHFIISHHNMGSWLFKLPRLEAHLAFRIRNILNGNILKSECWLTENDVDHGGGGISVYHSWSRALLADARAAGFDPIDVFANNPALARLQRAFSSDWLVRLAESAPYYALRKRD